MKNKREETKQLYLQKEKLNEEKRKRFEEQRQKENELRQEEALRKAEEIKSSLFTCKYLLPCGKCDKYNKLCHMI